MAVRGDREKWIKYNYIYRYSGGRARVSFEFRERPGASIGENFLAPAFAAFFLHALYLLFRRVLVCVCICVCIYVGAIRPREEGRVRNRIAIF